MKYAIIAVSNENPNSHFVFAQFEDKSMMQTTHEAICAQGLRCMEIKGVFCTLEMAELGKKSVNIQMENTDLPIIESVLKKGCYTGSKTQIEQNLVEVPVFFEKTTDIFQIGFDFAKQKTRLDNQKTEVVLENDDVVFAEEYIKDYDCEITNRKPFEPRTYGTGEATVLEIGCKKIADLFHLGFAVGLQRGFEVAGTKNETPNYID